MMDNLKGKTILIGKDPQQGKLCVAVRISGQFKAILLGNSDGVPGCVSRCQLQQGTAHAGIEIGEDGTMKLTNLKAQNVTYVEDHEIVSCRITPDSRIMLGKDRYPLDLKAVLAAASKVVEKVEPAPPKEFDISPLEQVWNDYHESLRKLGERQRKINLIRSGCGLFTMCAMPCIAVFGKVGYILTGIGIIGNLYSFFGLKNDNAKEEQERLTETFQDKYICPNPECGKYLPVTPYRLMKKQYSMTCPFCKCKFIEKQH